MMLIHVLFTAQEAMEKFNIEKVSLDWALFISCTDANDTIQDIAHHIKKTVRQRNTDNPNQKLTNTQFDERKGTTWHCIVGRNFGSFVTHGKMYRKAVRRLDR